MRYGACYYPEHWPEDRWPTDAKLMRDAGFNVVRMAEFAWVHMEPSEGRFNFDWLHRAIDLLADHGIQTVLGTPTAAPPAWLAQKRPDIMRVREDGHRCVFGLRQHGCVNSPDFRRASDRIVRAMAGEFGKHDAVIGWQIDNEFGQPCYCAVCRTEFQRWLADLYSGLDALNAAWGTTFWSQIYSDWSQIPTPTAAMGPPNPGLGLDYRRFMTSSFDTFQASQIAILRELSPGKPITHNFMGFLPETLDYRQLARDLDFASWDNYPMYRPDLAPARIAVNHDQTRGLKRRNFWVMEQQSGPAGWGTMMSQPRPGQLRLFVYQAVGRGADGILYFRWRPCRYGIEQYWHGILDHDGSTNRRYDEISKVGAELKSIWGELEGSEPVAEVAIINDYDSRFAFQIQKSNPEFAYADHARLYYDALHRLNVTVDVTCCDIDLRRYKIVIAPALFVLKEETAVKLRDYVESGGMLIATFRTGVKDQYSRIYDEPLPARLRDVFGMRVAEYSSPFATEENRIIADGFPESTARLWLDALEPDTAQVLAVYDPGGFAAGQPAITRNSFGSGTAIYVGCAPSQDFLNAFVRAICEERGVTLGPASPPNVEIAVRRKGDTELLFITNHNAEPVSVDSVTAGSELLTGRAVDGGVSLEPYGVAVVRR